MRCWWGHPCLRCCFQWRGGQQNAEPLHRVRWRVWWHRAPPRPVHRSVQLWRYIWDTRLLDPSYNPLSLLLMWASLFFQATARAPYPSQRASCWASWRRTKEMDGWGFWEAAVKRALYLRPMSPVIVKTVCHVFFKFGPAMRDQSNQALCSLQQERLSLYECAQHMIYLTS